MRKPATVLLLIPHLGGGGAEKVALLLARGLSRGKYAVHLGLVTQDTPVAVDAAWPVTVHRLGVRRLRYAAYAVVRLLWKVRPRVVIALRSDVGLLTLLMRPFLPRATRILFRQESTASAYIASGSLPAFTPAVYRLLLPLADTVLCSTRAMASDLEEVLGVRRACIEIVPNPIDTEGIERAIAADPPECVPRPRLLAIGRLAPEKGFDLLIEAFRAVRRRHPQARLCIAGTGPEEDSLRALCHRLELVDAVNFAGYVDPPYRLFAEAGLFVLSSRHEGMPNALLEAAWAGLPIAATPVNGVAELLRGQPGTWLARTISAEDLAVAILAALSHDAAGRRFKHAFLAPREFALERYEELIDRALEGLPA